MTASVADLKIQLAEQDAARAALAAQVAAAEREDRIAKAKASLTGGADAAEAQAATLRQQAEAHHVAWQDLDARHANVQQIAHRTLRDPNAAHDALVRSVVSGASPDEIARAEEFVVRASLLRRAYSEATMLLAQERQRVLTNNLDALREADRLEQGAARMRDQAENDPLGEQEQLANKRAR